MLYLAQFKFCTLFERHLLNPSLLIFVDSCGMMIKKQRKIFLIFRIDLLVTWFQYVHRNPVIEPHSLRNLKGILYGSILRIHRKHSRLYGDVIKLKLVFTCHKLFC